MRFDDACPACLGVGVVMLDIYADQEREPVATVQDKCPECGGDGIERCDR